MICFPVSFHAIATMTDTQKYNFFPEASGSIPHNNA